MLGCHLVMKKTTARQKLGRFGNLNAFELAWLMKLVRTIMKIWARFLTT